MADQDPGIRTVHISDLKHDPANARVHNPRNLGQIERSITMDGFGRSGLLASDFTIAAGNATADASASVGMEEVIIVDSDGTKPVYVRRTDLQSGSPEFRRLAIADNRSAELATWSADVLASHQDDGLDLEQFWFPDELARVVGDSDAFLDDAIGAGDGKSPWPDDGDSSDPNTMTLRVTPEGRDAIVAAARIMKRMNPAIDSTPEAIVAICEDYRCQHEF